MKRITTTIAGLAAALLLPAATAGELPSMTESAWVPIECQRPRAPVIQRDDAAALNHSIVEYNAYVDRVNAYTRCVMDEAERDMERIRHGANAAQAAVLGELRTHQIARTNER